MDLSGFRSRKKNSPEKLGFGAVKQIDSIQKKQLEQKLFNFRSYDVCKSFSICFLLKL